jgi:hypothetical protein
MPWTSMNAIPQDSAMSMLEVSSKTPGYRAYYFTTHTRAIFTNLYLTVKIRSVLTVTIWYVTHLIGFQGAG